MDLNFDETKISEKHECEESSYSKTDITFSAICILLGYLFIKFVFKNMTGLYSMIFNAVFCVLSVIYLKKSGKTLKKTNYILLAIIFIFNTNFIISSSSIIKSLDIIFVITLIVYWIYTISNNTEIFGESFIPEWINSAFNIPFNNYGQCPKSVIKVVSNKKSTKKLSLVFIGILIALPVTVIVAILLFSADAAFSNLFELLFSNILQKGFRFIFEFGLGLLIAFYLFGLLYGNTEKANILDNQNDISDNKYKKNVNPIIIYSSVTPICLLYLLFFFRKQHIFYQHLKTYFQLNLAIPNMQDTVFLNYVLYL